MEMTTDHFFSPAVSTTHRIPTFFYQSHHDYIPEQRRLHYGPRIATLLMYLSDVEEGGATHFPFLNVTVQPKRGRIVLWSNVLHTQPNVMDLRMVHQALPVQQGVKFASNLWIHQREMHPFSCYVTEDEYDDEETEDESDIDEE
jgi:2OG-Fe(II) oxygenase superfamily